MKKAKSSTKINLTPNDMWSLRNRELEGGIEGYAIAKPFFDARQQMWIREREKFYLILKEKRKNLNWIETEILFHLLKDLIF